MQALHSFREILIAARRKFKKRHQHFQRGMIFLIFSIVNTFQILVLHPTWGRLPLERKCWCKYGTRRQETERDCCATSEKTRLDVR